MKPKKAVLGAIALLVALGASDAALAWGRHGHAHFGVAVGGPLWWGPPYPYYYPPSYYYPPVYYPVAPAAPPVYVEQGAAPPAARENYWYYCAEAKGYYPYVKECPGGWQRVSPQPLN